MNTNPSCFSSLVVAGLLVAGSIPAQRQPLMGMPIVSTSAASASRADPVDGARSPDADPAAVTRGVKLHGKALAAAVKKVADLSWRKLDRAKVESRQTGRPILLLQTRGELDGFA
ncbi:MAG: hypothetical protein VX044_06035 [Planctomycetota bacterium]|nr:hypothetical protein [Planctomycetota bacterium]